MSAVEQIWDGNDRCGEAPLWDFRTKSLWWMDISVRRLFCLLPGNRVVEFPDLPFSASGAALNGSRGLVLGGEEGLFLYQNPNNHERIADEEDGDKLSINDLIADSDGRIYAGTIHWGENGMEQPGRLYLFDQSGAPRVVDEGIQLANGLGFSPDDCTLYLADSAARLIYAYNVDSANGSLSNRRVFARIPPEDGVPDGLTVDSEGFVWCAMWYGSQVIRFDPDGTLERRIPLPVSQVSSVAFGGDDLSTLYITTAAEPWPSPLEPPGFDWNARPPGGGLYAYRTDVQGRAEHLARIEPSSSRGSATRG